MRSRMTTLCGGKCEGAAGPLGQQSCFQKGRPGPNGQDPSCRKFPGERFLPVTHTGARQLSEIFHFTEAPKDRPEKIFFFCVFFRETCWEEVVSGGSSALALSTAIASCPGPYTSCWKNPLRVDNMKRRAGRLGSQNNLKTRSAFSTKTSFPGNPPTFFHLRIPRPSAGVFQWPHFGFFCRLPRLGSLAFSLYRISPPSLMRLDFKSENPLPASNGPGVEAAFSGRKAGAGGHHQQKTRGKMLQDPQGLASRETGLGGKRSRFL